MNKKIAITEQQLSEYIETLADERLGFKDNEIEKCTNGYMIVKTGVDDAADKIIEKLKKPGVLERYNATMECIGDACKIYANNKQDFFKLYQLFVPFGRDVVNFFHTN